jgi:hypothetical protein
MDPQLAEELLAFLIANYSQMKFSRGAHVRLWAWLYRALELDCAVWLGTPTRGCIVPLLPWV